MNDDFIRGLRESWQSQDQDAAMVLQRLRRRRWTPHAALAAEMLGCAVAILVGIRFVWVAAHTEQHRILFALSAGVMLVAVPALAIASALARRASLVWDDETPRVLLRVGMRRAEASLQAIRLGRWHIGIIASFVTILWILESVGLIHALGFLVFYSAICLAACVAGWFWMLWRIKRVRGERDACIRLLAIIQVDDSGDGAPSPAIQMTGEAR
jgi:hypothetical protein